MNSLLHFRNQITKLKYLYYCKSNLIINIRNIPRIVKFSSIKFQSLPQRYQQSQPQQEQYHLQNAHKKVRLFNGKLDEIINLMRNKTPSPKIIGIYDEKDKIRFDENSINRLLIECNKSRNIEYLNMFYKDMIMDKMVKKPGRTEMDVLEQVEYYFKNAEPIKAVEYFLNIKSKHIQENPLVLLELFQGLFAFNGIQKAFDVYKEISSKGIMIDKNIGHYLIVMFGWKEQLTFADIIYDNMISSNIEPRLPTLFELCFFYINSGYESKVKQIISIILRMNPKLDFITYKVDIVEYCLIRLLNQYAITNNKEEMVNTINLLNKLPKSLNPSNKKYKRTAFLSAYCRLGQLTKVMEIWDDILKSCDVNDNSIQPATSIVCDAIGFYGTLENLERFWDLVINYHSSNKIRLNTNHYNSYIQALYRLKAPHQTIYEVLTKDMLTKEISPDVKTIVTLLGPLGRNNKSSTINKILEFIKNSWPQAFKRTVSTSSLSSLSTNKISSGPPTPNDPLQLQIQNPPH
ncbi:8733_t:CDS:2 [Entrophospora sp. SA101]|nr:8733_t:CDS:2 [Entrophospora sp. SA101]